MSHEHDDNDTNASSNPDFRIRPDQTRLAPRNVRRRGRRRGAGGRGPATAAKRNAQARRATGGRLRRRLRKCAAYRPLKLNFNPVAKNLEDAVTLPQGYSYDVLYALGDPIAAHVSDYANDGTDNPATYVYRAGDHHDGMYFFGMGANGRYSPYDSARGLLCMNHEAITPAFLHPTGQTIVNSVRTVAEEVQREFYIHGVSVIEIVREKNRRREDWSACFRRRYDRGRSVDWDYQQRSRYNRRIHTLTEMQDVGPGGGHAIHGHEVFTEWPAHARHGEQLRQRLHALGHVSHLRRELRRLLPPRGGH